MIAKIRRDRAEVIVVVPDWPIEHWYPHVVNMGKQTPFYIQPSPSYLIFPHDLKKLRPLHKNLQLMNIMVILLN